MNERPTPETDAFSNRSFEHRSDELEKLYDHAIRLERERDEALKLFISSKRARASLSKACDSLQKELRETKRERDEARRKCANLEEIIRVEWPIATAEALIRQAKESAK